MLRVVLQRFAVQRSIAEQLEAVPLDEVLRRMQSSSLTNPARSLESHFTLAAEEADAPFPAPASSAYLKNSSSKAHLRNALSERLLAEIRQDIRVPHLSLDACSLMLANCLRHQLSPVAVQQIFALWLKFMQHGAGPGPSPPSTLGSLSVIGLGRGVGSAQACQFTQFQCLVRVMEACLDAQEQRRLPSAGSGDDRADQLDAMTMGPQSQGDPRPRSVCLTLGHWAELVDTVEQYWKLLVDHGASTTCLLVQFTALALELTGSASSTPAETEAGNRFADSLRRLGHLQTDRALLQSLVLRLCGEAVEALCTLESAKGVEEEAALGSQRRSGPWWRQPQELVRLSQARRRIEAYEFSQLCRRDRRNTVGVDEGAGGSAFSEGDPTHHPASTNSSMRRKPDKTQTLSGGAVRGARVGMHGHTATFPHALETQSPTTSNTAPRWLPRLSNSWWPSSAPSLVSGGGAAAGHAAALRSGQASVRVAKQLGRYVTHHALQQAAATSWANSRNASVRSGRDAQELNRGSNSSDSAPMSRPPALMSVSLEHILEIFETVCATAASSGAVEHVTTFSWWVRDVIHSQHGRRSLCNVEEMMSLLGIAELCLDYPDGTQTVLAEIMKCLGHSTRFLWEAGTASHLTARCLPAQCTFALWPRACEVVASALPLTTVRPEADRTLRAFVGTAQQALSTLKAKPAGEENAEEAAQLLLRHRRYGVLVLACLLLQQPDGYVTPVFSERIHELALAVPFTHTLDGPSELAAAVRALYAFTRPGMPFRKTSRGNAGQRREAAVFYVLNQITELLASSAAAGTDRLESSAGPYLPRGLSSLSTTERQLLRCALREVRASRTEGAEASRKMESTIAEAPCLHERATDGARSTNDCKYSLDLAASLTSDTTSASSAPSSTTSSERAVPIPGSSSIPVPGGRAPATTASSSRMVQPPDFDEHVLQREIEAVSSHFGGRQAALKPSI
ncbi:hypothetical protein ABL78_4422 [Leptomonas seymouri]|uniref:Uncharacterized protein n=1 Tax=Leptomonas seymouri TaxID=5684 RepID=A0A0N1PE49_LEPSE|nr:hypothetical protein ABL78_4422 [Leptomonas seymouri]|eukprot:KPI86520.1 hypothetical protein ABL78_4422 [Leptomonas seymouri]